MTIPTPASPAGSSPSSGIAVRPLAAWALLALAATIVAFGFLSWIFPEFQTDFVNRFRVGTFTDLRVLVAPLLAVLLATRTGATLPQARLMSLVALAEYAAALLFGTLALLLGLAGRFDVGDRGGFYAFGGVVAGLGGLIVDLLLLALLALAGLYTLQAFTRLGGRLPTIDVRTD